MVCLIHPLDDRYMDYLIDESRLQGRAQSISFPENEVDVQQLVCLLSEQNIPITIQGSRTGITGGAVPTGGHVLNLSAMHDVTGLSLDKAGKFSIHVQPGISLATLNQQLSTKRFNTRSWDKYALSDLDSFKKADRHFWPPDPSEKSASVGGIAATNARGICAHHYGSARHHINSIRMVNARGDVHTVKRGHYLFSKGVCPLPEGNELRLDPAISGSTKGLDLLDVYLGSEGMLGVITELELCLEPMASEIWGIVFFFTAQSRALEFIELLISGQLSGVDTHIVAMEFMDHTTLKNIQQHKKINSSLHVFPDIDPGFVSAVCLEIHSFHEEKIEAISERIMAVAETIDCNMDMTWAFCNENEMERFHLFRHAAPASANFQIDMARQSDTRITKISTDMKLKTGSAIKLLEMYQRDLKKAGLTAAIFGHAGDGLFHVNILPETYKHYIKAKALVEKWAAYITMEGGSAVTEHGIGKVKSHLFSVIPLPQQFELLFRLKEKLDPDGIWNPGNIKKKRVLAKGCL